MRKEAVDRVELEFGLGFALQLPFERLVAIHVQGEDLLEGLGCFYLLCDFSPRAVISRVYGSQLVAELFGRGR